MAQDLRLRPPKRLSSRPALEAPILLLNSGIGESTTLTNLGIQPRVNLPDVGQNSSVHIGTGLDYFVNATDTFDDIIRNSTLRQILLDEWNQTNGGGPLGSGFGIHHIFVRLPFNSTILKTHPDPAPGPDSPHSQTAVQNGDLNPPPEGHFVNVGATLVTPVSRGTIRLNTTSPFDQPLIDLACLTSDLDIAAIREGMKISMRLISANAWQGYVLGPSNNITNTPSDADLDAFARSTASPNGHIIGTASMSPRGANYGVVDPDLLVKGVHLRIVDASVLPFITSGNTQVPVYIFSERASDLIKAKWE